MTTNPYMNAAPRLTPEDDINKPSGSDATPQYVHRVKPDPPPEISQTTDKDKDVKDRCVKFAVAAVISLLLLLLVAGILLGYYYSSSCLHGMQCGDGNCVWESQWCNGVEDCPAGQDEANCVRVCGSSFQLQIYSTRTKDWRRVCSQGWSDQHGHLSCQDIGYDRGTYFKSGQEKADGNGGFLSVKTDSQRSILQQLTHSDSCPDNSVVTVQCTDCGKQVNSSAPSGGQRASLGSWPWQVSLHAGGSHRCGGAIISPSWIVTAAHCVSRTPSPGDWMVYAGIVDPFGPLFNPAYSVSQIVTHEGYNSITRQNDIALMKLSRPLDTAASSKIGPVCLHNSGLNFTDLEESWITYFVPSAKEEPGSVYLMESQVALLDSAECNSSVTYHGRISQDMLCVRELETGADTCQPDSGGPLVSLKDGRWWLMGDSVWGGNCSGKQKPGVFGQTAHHLNWIFQQMKRYQHA